MKRKKEIFCNRDAFGSYGYRVMADADVVAIQERYRGGRWKTLVYADRAVFNRYADEIDLFNPYRHNPAHLGLIANLLKNAVRSH